MNCINKNFVKQWKLKVLKILMMPAKIKFNAEFAGVMKMTKETRSFWLANAKVL